MAMQYLVHDWKFDSKKPALVRQVWKSTTISKVVVLFTAYKSVDFKKYGDYILNREQWIVNSTVVL